MSEAPDPQRYRRLRELFLEAVALEGASREEFLERQALDAATRRELDGLLEADARDSDPLGTQAAVAAGALAAGPALPERIGRYRILSLLGEGGMGSVYAAEQDTPRRTVALKLMHAGLLTPSMLRRFEFEAEVLARLAHPGIAHVYEAGTAEIGGATVPFFAMELVQGVPITRFADERRLDLRERLELVARVADAVEFAHHSGVIHRDLKPQNILVDAGGQPRVLDFGVARAAQEAERSATQRTQSGLLIGTLSYMSPEQAGGDPRALDTRADVYALGVIAYELVTGRLPHDLSRVTLAAAARIIAEEEPVRPGVLDRRLRGDIETILLKALEKDKQRRYASAAALAADLRAYLDHQPIAARRATTLYTLSRFARRHTGLVAGIAATFVALAAGLAISLAYYSRSEVARASEARQHKRADSINRFVLQEILAAPDPWAEAGKDVSVASILDRISGKVRSSFADDPELEADAQFTLAGSYLGRGLNERAAEHVQRALELRRALHPEDHLDLADSLLASARVHAERGELAPAESEARGALEMFGRLAEAPPQKLVEARRQLARVQLAKGEHAAALREFEAVLEAVRELFPGEGPELAQSLSDLLAVRTAMGDTGEAERLGREVLRLRRALYTDDSPYVALSLTDLSTILFERRDEKADQEGLDLAQEACTILERRLGPEHRLTLLTRRNYANTLVRFGRNGEAERILRELVEVLPRVIGVEHQDYLQTLNSHGYVLFLMQRLDEAEARYEKAIELGTRVLGADHDDVLRPLSNLAHLEKQRGVAAAQDADGDGFPDAGPGSDLGRAIEHFRAALAGFERVYGPEHENSGGVVYALADTLNLVGQKAEAAQLFGRRARMLLAKHEQDDDETATRMLMLQGQALLSLKRDADAEAPLRQCVELCERLFPGSDWRTAICTGLFGECLAHLARYDEAEPLLAASLDALASQREKRRQDHATAVERLAALYEARGLVERAKAVRASGTSAR